MPLETLGALTGSEGKASVIYIKSDNTANDGAIRREIESTKGLEGYRVQSMEDILSMYTPARIPAVNLTLNVMITIAVIVGFLVTFQSMYTAVLERTLEIGIPKSMGALRLAVVGVVLRECAVLAVGGVLVGIAATYGVRAFLSLRFQSFSIQRTGTWIVNGTLIAFSGALCGALYPAWMVARKDPIDALAYE